MKNNFTQKRTKQVTTFTALLLFFMAIAFAASAGSKNVKAEIVTPAAGAEINSGKPFTVSVKITNNDMMYPLDKMMDMPTIQIKVDGKVVATDTLMLSANVPAMGGTATLTSKPHSVTFTADKASAQLCITAGIAFATNSSTAGNPCQAVAMKVSPTGIGNVAGNASVEVYPNPASTQINVNLPADVKAVMSIYDFTGRVMAQHDLNGKTNSVPVAGLSSGNYIYRITDGNGQTYNGKIAIQ